MKSHPKSRHSYRGTTLPPTSPKQSALFASHGSRITIHQSRIAGASLSHRSSLATLHCPNRSLAKHNRKPMQIIENNQQRSKSISSFCRVFYAWRGKAARSPKRGGALQSQTRQHGQDCLCHDVRCELDEAAAFRYRSRFC